MTPYLTVDSKVLVAGLRQLIGRKCWRLTLFPEVENHMALHFGQATPRALPIWHEQPKQVLYGEFRLLVCCDWSLGFRSGRHVSRNSLAMYPEQDSFGVCEEALGKLEVTNIRFDEMTGSLALSFGQEADVAIRPIAVNVDRDEPDYVFYDRSTVFLVKEFPRLTISMGRTEGT